MSASLQESYSVCIYHPYTRTRDMIANKCARPMKYRECVELQAIIIMLRFSARQLHQISWASELWSSSLDVTRWVSDSITGWSTYMHHWMENDEWINLLMHARFNVLFVYLSFSFSISGSVNAHSKRLIQFNSIRIHNAWMANFFHKSWMRSVITSDYDVCRFASTWPEWK